jgi:hypothetical protein
MWPPCKGLVHPLLLRQLTLLGQSERLDARIQCQLMGKADIHCFREYALSEVIHSGKPVIGILGHEHTIAAAAYAQ